MRQAKDDKKNKPAIMGRPDADESKQEKADPRPLIKKALARHDLHASGAELADEYSNTKLRKDLQAALEALEADVAEEGEGDDKEAQ